jgi:uncharacterized membrane protein
MFPERKRKLGFSPSIDFLTVHRRRKFMHRKLLATSLGIVILGVIGFSIVSFNLLNGTSAKTITEDSQTITSAEKISLNSTSTPTNPNDISDRLAYTLFFRFLANPTQQQNENLRRIRSYLGQKGLSRRNGETCPARLTDEADINALLTVVTEFQQRVDILDQRATQLKRQNRINPSPAVTTQLAQLQQQKEAIVDEIINSLPRRLGNDAASELQRFVRDHVKRQIQFR